ncbi:unnamed protein product [Lactuca saligna]|uniref:F-box associated beta-propeller type 3 domain-containing protein n=1 Tax=Lactuca saligna TaxID=75948 RepID=A0AA35ZCX0_LACSI|nr:unnamed protein product [Lactuca saligna]
MRCLSKSWNALLSEPSFIKSHLHRSIQSNNNDGILLHFSKLFSFDSKPFTARPYRTPHLELTNFINLPVKPQSENSRGKVIGSVNGLICFKYGSNHNPKYNVCQPDPDSYFIYGSDHPYEYIYIWNPSLSALLTLPPYSMPSHSTQQFFRFGFDPKTDDYKVVKITRRLFISPNTVVFMEWLPVEVYSMRKGSWKFITQRIPSRLKNISDFDDLCVDGHKGHLHWQSYYYRGKNGFKKKTILVYDLGAETFREIPLPDSLTGGNAKDVWIKLGVLAGKLCVMSTVPGVERQLWVMDEYGVAESWVKHRFFPPFRGYRYSYGFTLQNEFLFQVSVSVLGYDHGLYDPVAATTKVVKLGYNVRGKVIDYVDSLVWVSPAEQRERNCCSISQFQF